MKITNDDIKKLQQGQETYRNTIEIKSRNGFNSFSDADIINALEFVKEYRRVLYSAFKQVTVNSGEYSSRTVQFIKAAEKEFTKTSQGLLHYLDGKVNRAKKSTVIKI